MSLNYYTCAQDGEELQKLNYVKPLSPENVWNDVELDHGYAKDYGQVDDGKPQRLCTQVDLRPILLLAIRDWYEGTLLYQWRLTTKKDCVQNCSRWREILSEYCMRGTQLILTWKATRVIEVPEKAASPCSCASATTSKHSLCSLIDDPLWSYGDWMYATLRHTVIYINCTIDQKMWWYRLSYTIGRARRATLITANSLYYNLFPWDTHWCFDLPTCRLTSMMGSDSNTQSSTSRSMLRTAYVEKWAVLNFSNCRIKPGVLLSL